MESCDCVPEKHILNIACYARASGKLMENGGLWRHTVTEGFLQPRFLQGLASGSRGVEASLH